VTVSAVDAHINDPAFAEGIVAAVRAALG
jgi:uncharacterized protein (UPF0261 family)